VFPGESAARLHLQHQQPTTAAVVAVQLLPQQEERQGAGDGESASASN
jgi:hypothetical protein